MKKCHYCGHKNQFPRVPNPIKCPRCGNPYGQKPQRKLWGKYTIMLVLIFCLCAVPAVMGVRENFQDYTSDGTGIMCFQSGTIGVGNPFTMAQSPNSYYIYTSDPAIGNNWMYVIGNSYLPAYGGLCGAGITNYVPTPSTYYAWDADHTYGNYGGFDTNTPNKINIYSGGGLNGNHRYEIKIIGGTPTLFIDGVQTSTLAPISINPSYSQITDGFAAYGNFGIDNLVIGESDHHIVGALPTNWTIQRDLLNPSATGVYAWDGSAWQLKNSHYFYLDADKEFGSIADPSPENVVIKDYATQTIVNTTSVSVVRNTILYNITQFLNTPTSLGTSLPDGMYTVSFENSPAITDTFWVISSGATMSWDQPIYSQGSTGKVIYSIAGSGYWDQSTYSYSMVTKNIYGTTMNTQTIGAQSGTISVPITASYSPGVYYAEILATKISDGTVSTMNYAVMQVTSYIPMNGYVMNEETGAVIPSANMNISQGAQYQTVTSDASGAWSSNNGWMAGSTITINTTATGFKQDIHSFLPLNAASVFLNITMSPTVSAYSGVSIGGTVKDHKFGNPVVGALYHVMNNTESVSTTNIAGFARVDGLVNGNLYAVWSSKTGYGNSSIVNITAVGS